jgi:hypothetical protein
MADHLLVWDHNELALWRRARGEAKLVATGTAEDIAGVIEFLEAAPLRGLRRTLRVAVDAVWLDHHFERFPPAKGRLLTDLVRRRLEKQGGPEMAGHDWALHQIDSHGGPHAPRLLVSLPPTLSIELARHAKRHGVALLGVHSLPLAIGQAFSCSSAGAQLLRFGAASYVAAYNPYGAFLYALRVPMGQEPEASQRVSRRLSLFLEQELNEKIATLTASETPAGVDVPADALWNTLRKSCDLLPRRVHRARIAFRARLALMVVALAALSPAVDFLRTGFDRRASALSSKQTSSEEADTSAVRAREAEETLAVLRRKGSVVEFASGRSREGGRLFAESPLLIATHFVATPVPNNVELDRLALRLDPADRAIRVSIAGRPLSPEINLDTQLDLYQREMAFGTFKFTEPKREMLRGRTGRFATSEAASRQFQLEFKLKETR